MMKIFPRQKPRPSIKRSSAWYQTSWGEHPNRMKVTHDKQAWIDPNVMFEGSAHIGFGSCVGYGTLDAEPAYIGDGVRVGAFCVIEHGVHIEAGVEIDHYCRIASGVRI